MTTTRLFQIFLTMVHMRFGEHVEYSMVSFEETWVDEPATPPAMKSSAYVAPRLMTDPQTQGPLIDSRLLHKRNPFEAPRLKPRAHA